jgi:hypothetical protein
MIDRIVITTLKFLASAFTLTLLLAQIPAAALPNEGAAALGQQATAPDDPNKVVSAGFEQIIGRDLNAKEAQQVNQAIQQLQKVQPHAQPVNYVTDLWDRYEKLPVVCLYGKFDGKIPFSKKGITLNGLSLGYEITPCLVLNSFDPLAWRVREFRSYIMQGGSLSSAGGDFGGISGGLLIGVYAGPKNLAKPLIGTYGFVRLAAEETLVKFAGQIAYGTDHQVLALVGVGAELSIDAVLQAVRVMPKVSTTSVQVAGVKADVGMYFSVKEFPWFQRLVLQGQNPIVAFSDMKTYLAAN